MMQYAMLNVLEGPLQGRALAITQHENLLGREAGCELLLEGYSRVSRRHARLHWDGWQFHLTDLNSTNGVLVDGQRIQSSALRGGSVLHIGDFVAQLWLPPSPPAFLDQPVAQATIPARTAVLPTAHAQPPGPPQALPYAPPHQPAPPYQHPGHQPPYPGQYPAQHQPPYAPPHPPTPAPSGAPKRSIPGTPVQRAVAGFVALGVLGMMMVSGSGGGGTTPPRPESSATSSGLSGGLGAEPREAGGSEPGEGGKISAQSIARAKAATVLIVHPEGDSMAMGSGFVTGDGTRIVTNRHVVVDGSGQATDCLVIFNSGGEQQTKAEVLAARIELAPSTGESNSFIEDLAVLTLPERVVEPVAMGRTEDLSETDTLYAVGFPLGVGTLTLGNQLPSASVKAVSVERLQKGTVDGAEAVGVLQLGGTITHGNSGGPILSARGEVVGVVSRGPEAEGTGMSYAIPTVFVKALLRD